VGRRDSERRAPWEGFPAARPRVSGTHRSAPRIEEVVLDPAQERGRLLVEPLALDDAQDRVQLVDRAIGLDARMIFGTRRLFPSAVVPLSPVFV